LLEILKPILDWLDPNNTLKVSDWIALVAAFISLLSVVVTAWFSYMVYKVSHRSTQIAQESFVFSKTNVEKGNQEKQLSKEGKKRQLISDIYNRVEEVIHALTTMDPTLIEKMPRDPGISIADWAMYFNDEDHLKIENTWSSVQVYIRGYWHIHGGPFQHNLSGSEWEDAIKAGDMLLQEFINLSYKVQRIKI
jgi:hypothetical protein